MGLDTYAVKEVPEGDEKALLEFQQQMATAIASPVLRPILYQPPSPLTLPRITRLNCPLILAPAPTSCSLIASRLGGVTSTPRCFGATLSLPV